VPIIKTFFKYQYLFFHFILSIESSFNSIKEFFFINQTIRTLLEHKKQN